MIDYLQWSGHNRSKSGLALLLYKPWAIEEKSKSPEIHTVTVGWFCCDGPECGLPFGITADKLWPMPPAVPAEERSRTKNCPKVQQNALRISIYHWHQRQHEELQLGNCVLCDIFLPNSMIEVMLKLIKPTLNPILEILSELGCGTGGSFQPYALEIFDIISQFDTVDWPKYARGVQDKVNAEALKHRHKLRQTEAVMASKQPPPQPPCTPTNSKSQIPQPRATKVLNDNTNNSNHSLAAVHGASSPPSSPSHRRQTRSRCKAVELLPNQPTLKRIRKNIPNPGVSSLKKSDGIDLEQSRKCGRGGRGKGK
ncbi:hypothetical protein BS47DRAFT_1369704 [Hydnum rufescens UP504]|uniref:Uncharacterized protein n=1 Tax=Hydnum rufescens UP504 TaxID=1448309 RepID=A0A9P6ADL9_9AGAM|nr:hypothetical protein BS47DRAFT_1369704 [Hydnum rufescens UP504]